MYQGCCAHAPGWCLTSAPDSKRQHRAVVWEKASKARRAGHAHSIDRRCGAVCLAHILDQPALDADSLPQRKRQGGKEEKKRLERGLSPFPRLVSPSESQYNNNDMIIILVLVTIVKDQGRSCTRAARTSLLFRSIYFPQYIRNSCRRRPRRTADS